MDLILFLCFRPVKVDWELQVIGRAIIKQVTALDLNRTYTCVARNIAGNNNVTVSLKVKNKGTRLYCCCQKACYTISLQVSFEVKTQHSDNMFLSPCNVNSVSVKWLSLVEYSVGPLLFVAGLVIILHVKWLEIQMIYRSRWRLSKPHGGKKTNTIEPHR